MPLDAVGESARRLRGLVTIVLFVLIGTAYLGWSWTDILGGYGGDNATYLFMARNFSPYSTATEVTEHFATKSVYPPLFPMLLGLTGGGESLLSAHLVTTLFLLGAFGVFYWWMRREGVGPVASPAAVVVLASIPGVYLQTLSIHSENLYLLCSLATLSCASAAQGDRNHTRWMIAAAAALAAAYLTRGAGLALVVAWLAWLWINRVPGRTLYSLLALLPVFLWHFLGGTGSAAYWELLTERYFQTSHFPNQLLVQAQHVFEGWLINFGGSGTARTAGISLLLLGLFSAGWRLWLRRIDGFYVWCYLGMIVLWPYPREAPRMVFVLLPVLLFQTAWTFCRWQANVRIMKVVHAAFLALLMLCMSAELALNVNRFVSELPPNVPEGYRHSEHWYARDINDAIYWVRLFAAIDYDLSQLHNEVSEYDCIFSIKPSIVAYQSDRMSMLPPKMQSDEREFDLELREKGCQYFYLVAFRSTSYRIPWYPYQRMHDDLIVIKETSSNAEDEQAEVVGVLAKIK